MSIFAPTAPRGLVGFQDEGTAVPLRQRIDGVGAGITITDDPTNGRTLFTVPGATGSGTYPGTVYTAAGGTTDDTAAIQAILDGFATTGGGELIIVGMCRVSGLTYSKGNLRIRGAYPSSARPAATNPASCGFINTSSSTTTLDMSLALTTAAATPTDQQNVIEDICFFATTQMTGGWAVELGTSSCETTIQRCWVFGDNYGYSKGHKNGIRVWKGAQNIRMYDNFIAGCTGTAMYLDQNEDTATGNEGGGTTGQVWGGSISNCGIGLDYRHRDAWNFTGVAFVANNANVYVRPSPRSNAVGANLLGTKFIGCFFDYAAAVGVSLAGDGSSPLRDWVFLGCWFGSDVLTIGASCTAIRVEGCHFEAGGVRLSSGQKHALITGNTFDSPANQGGASGLCALLVDNGVNDFTFTSNVVYRTAAGTVTGVTFSGTSDRFINTLNRIHAASGSTAQATFGTPGGATVINTNNLTSTG